MTDEDKLCVAVDEFAAVSLKGEVMEMTNAETKAHRCLPNSII